MTTITSHTDNPYQRRSADAMRAIDSDETGPSKAIGREIVRALYSVAFELAELRLTLLEKNS